MEKKKKLWQVLIPVLVALAVIVAFAISGTITRRADEKKPTAPNFMFIRYHCVCG